MTTSVLLNDEIFTLHRMPLDQKNRSLQAWDSADEYVLQHIKEHHQSAKNILVFNDSFGALSCVLSKQAHVTAVTDSYISQLAYYHNFAENNLDTSRLTVLSSLDALPHEVDLIVIKVPKNSGFLQDHLSKLSYFKADIPVVGAGKVKEIHTSTLKSFQHFLADVKTSLAQKKSRLIFSSTQHKKQVTKFPVEWPLEQTEFTLTNHANVFSRDSLDIGARFFMNYLPRGKKAQQIIDLGCGNGVIGLTVLSQMPNATLTFIDESAMAVASAKINVEKNLPERFEDCQFKQNDCLSDYPAHSADIVLCNPPFHQANAITDHIAWQMFVQAKHVLRHGGELRIIGNRHLDYKEKLTRLFGNCKLIGSNKKFSVLQAFKRD